MGCCGVIGSSGAGLSPDFEPDVPPTIAAMITTTTTQNHHFFVMGRFTFAPHWGQVFAEVAISAPQESQVVNFSFNVFSSFYLRSVDISVFIIVKIFTKVNSKYFYLRILPHRKVGEDMNAYTINLRNLREDHDLTQQQVAEYLGTSQTMVARYEREASELPLRHFIRLCQLYQVSADEVLGLRRRK